MEDEYIWTAPGMRHIESNVDEVVAKYCGEDAFAQMILLAGHVKGDVGILIVFNDDDTGTELEDADISRRDVFGSTAMYVETLTVETAAVSDGEPALQHFADKYDVEMLFDVVSGSEIEVDNPHSHDGEGDHHHH